VQDRAAKLRWQRIRSEHGYGHSQQLFGVNFESGQRQKAGRFRRINEQIKVALLCVGAAQNRSEARGCDGPWRLTSCRNSLRCVARASDGFMRFDRSMPEARIRRCSRARSPARTPQRRSRNLGWHRRAREPYKRTRLRRGP